MCAYFRDTEPEHAERRGHGVAAALDRELHDVLGVEVGRVRRERRARRVLDALVDRQDRHVAGAAQAAGVEERLQAAQHARRAVRTPRRCDRRSRDRAGAGRPCRSSCTDARAAPSRRPESPSIFSRPCPPPLPASPLDAVTTSPLDRALRSIAILPPAQAAGKSKSSTSALRTARFDKFVDRQLALARFHVVEPRPRGRVARREQRAAVLIRE